ncbi:hypothetical protein OPT61_g4119 [Boeremia exigua]|uniref:Uncharacterized protein n=1 Tax=Boeremia exigua TaxID=749465 RepID=A0ACC2IFJ1_9PLEO|nr:hypothetical protein OPT61_g4119 [Boeremia exigua]
MTLFNILPAFVFLALVSADVSTRSLVKCQTYLGISSVANPKTTSKVLTIPWYAFKITTYTPVTTVTVTTPAVSTEFTSTVITVTPTTTVPAPAGFIPVRTSLPGALKRREAQLENRGSQLTATVKNGKLVCSPPVYPNSVECKGLVAVITTLTITKTSRTTSTAFANAQVYTSTTTIIATNTVQAPQETFYAACGPDNLATSYNGSPINFARKVAGGNDVGFSQIFNADGYTCCVNCLMTPGCFGAARVTNGDCFTFILANTGQCSQSDAGNQLKVGAGGLADDAVVVSNGPCGAFSIVETS